MIYARTRTHISENFPAPICTKIAVHPCVRVRARTHTKGLQVADNNKVLSEENKRLLKNFRKQPTFCYFTNETRQQSLLHSTQKVCETDRSQKA